MQEKGFYLCMNGEPVKVSGEVYREFTVGRTKNAIS